MLNKHQKLMNKNNRRKSYEKFVTFEGNYDEGTKFFSLYREFVISGVRIQREFVMSLLGRIQGTKHLVRYTGKFVISGVRYTGIPLQ